MNPIDASEARASLKKKGFELKQNDHEFYFYYHLGKKTAWRVKISHGTKQLKQREIRGNAKVLHMTGEELRGVLDCSRDAEWIKSRYMAQNSGGRE
jgi:hypothetical protein